MVAFHSGRGQTGKDQPYYHLYAENAETTYLAYVSEQNLLLDETHQPLCHPDITERFLSYGNGGYRLRPGSAN